MISKRKLKLTERLDAAEEQAFDDLVEAIGGVHPVLLHHVLYLQLLAVKLAQARRIRAGEWELMEVGACDPLDVRLELYRCGLDDRQIEALYPEAA